MVIHSFFSQKMNLNTDDRPFVDREAFVQAFRENIQNLRTKDYNVLFYYGIAGIGKSKLQKELQRILEEEHPDTFWVSIDLKTETYREIGTFLFTLRNKIHEKCNAKFYLFNIAHAIYWKKLHPEITLQKENYPLVEEGWVFSKIIDGLNELGPVRLAFDIINYIPYSITTYFKEREININKLATMEAPEIEKLLPCYFAKDFTNYLGTDSNAYIFIDTYEAIWKGLRNQGSFHEKDGWIRDNLIPNMLGVSWVICGREKLLWVPECDSDWDIYLEQHSVDGLPESYCTEFLEDCGIENKDIRDIIIKASEGVPYYLNLSVDTYEKIRKNRQPIPDDFGDKKLEIFNRFVQYLNVNEIRALEVLSAPNFWDRDMFKILMKKFDPGFPTGAFTELIKFSFIITSTHRRFSIHQLMRKSLQEHQNSVERENVHKFMFEYYSCRLKKLDTKTITKEHEIALTEAFFHAKESLAVKDLFYWFLVASNPFKKAAFWKLISPLYEQMLKFIEEKLGSENRYFTKTLNKLASICCNMGAYKEAINYYELALKISGKIGDKHGEILSCGNLGLVNRELGEYKKAIDYHKQALKISREIEDRLREENQLGNLGNAYRDQGEFKKAIECYENALKTAIEIGDRPKEGIWHGNQGNTYRFQGELKKAFEYYEEALKIARDIGDKRYEGIWLGNQGIAYRDQGEFKKAIECYENALEIAIEIGPKRYEGIWLGNLGIAYHYLGEPEKAIDYYELALKIAKIIWDKRNEGVWQGYKGDTYRDKGELEKAFECYENALKIAEDIGDKRRKGKWQGHIGDAHRDQGEFKKAIECYENALKTAIEIGDRPKEGIWHGNQGNTYRFQGELKKAFECYETALKIARDIGDKRYEGIWLGNQGITYGEMKKFEKAVEYHNKALKIACEIGDKRYEGIWLGNLGIAYYNFSEKKKGIENYKKALKIARDIGDKRYEGVWQGYKGDACRDKGDPKKAIDYYEKALKIAEEIGDKRRKGKWQGHMGNAYRDLGKPKKAIDCFKQALDIAIKIGDRRRVETWIEQLENAYHDLGETKKEFEFLKESLTIGKSIEDQKIISYCEQKLKELEKFN